MSTVSAFAFFPGVIFPFVRSLLFFYTDPGSGAMVWQMTTAFVVAGMFYVTLAFRRVRIFVRKIAGPRDKPLNIRKENSPGSESYQEN